MKKPKINLTVIKEDSGYSAYSNTSSHFISTQAENFEELKKNVLDAINLTFEEQGYIYGIDEVDLKYDFRK